MEKLLIALLLVASPVAAEMKSQSATNTIWFDDMTPYIQLLPSNPPDIKWPPSDSRPVPMGDLAIIKPVTPPESTIDKDGTIWSSTLKITNCIKMSPYTKECVTKMAWEFGLRKDGTVVWREVEVGK